MANYFQIFPPLGFSFSPTAENSRLELEFEESLPRKTASIFKEGIGQESNGAANKKETNFLTLSDLAFGFVHKRSGNEINDAAIFPLNRVSKYFPDLACGAIFRIIIYKQQLLHSDWLKTCQLIPNQWYFTSATLNDVQYQR